MGVVTAYKASIEEGGGKDDGVRKGNRCWSWLSADLSAVVRDPEL